MAVDLNEQISNMYNAAAKAIEDDLTQNFYSAAQARTQAFRQLNNSANANHSLYSGAPAAAQMQYDASTFLPGAATAATRNMAKLQNNQEAWDEYMDYVNELNAKAAEYNKAASGINDFVNKNSGIVNGWGGIDTNTKGRVTGEIKEDDGSAQEKFADGKIW